MEAPATTLAIVFACIVLRASDPAASAAFYATVLPQLGRGADPRELRIEPAGDGPVTRGLHVGFAAAGPAQVEAFWGAGVNGGHRDDGAPGPRPSYGPDYVGGFLLDPDGNSAEAALHDNVRTHGLVDHLWIRVADHAASRAFYAAHATAAGLVAVADEPGLTRWRRAERGGSFTVLEDGTPTMPLEFHLTPGREAVDAVDPDGHRFVVAA